VLRPHVDPELRHSRPSSELPPGDVLAVDLLGEVLPERVELEVRWEQDPFEVRVAFVLDPHEVPGLPSVEIRGPPEARHALDLRHGTARDLRHRLGDGAHIWMTSSFLSAYCVATNMIPRNRKIENLAAGDEELRRPPHAKAQRRRNTAATSKTTKIRANM